eukprot:COSAG06_NODE_280_length_18452_cov_26.989660_1_plen_35_part_00
MASEIRSVVQGMRVARAVARVASSSESCGELKVP